ncbi:MAG: hypothetical protein E7563_06585 [Ruminococcaceae bacterium]|nr:hypothetical protein [Oscillospiraceae bacterium]
MNKICKEYISEIKALFPIKRKPEKDYIKKVAADIKDYCEEENVTSKQDLYDNYGKPNDVVNNYFATVDTEYVVKQIKVARFIKTAVALIIVLATIATSALCICAYVSYQLADKEAVVVREDSIIEIN